MAREHILCYFSFKFVKIYFLTKDKVCLEEHFCVYLERKYTAPVGWSVQLDVSVRCSWLVVFYILDGFLSTNHIDH